MRQLKDESGTSFRDQCRLNGYAYRTFLRHLSRIRRGAPAVAKRGPRKIEFNPALLLGELRELPQGPHRTGGLGQLHESWQRFISRQDLRDLAEEVRREHQQAERAELRRVRWLVPGATWAMDDTHVGYDEAGRLLQHTNTMDLASKYLFAPMLGTPSCGEAIAGHLDRLCQREGPPLVLKRDNGSNLNHPMVQEVLAAYGVIVLNSPVAYPPYNGVNERFNGCLKSDLRLSFPTFSAIPAEFRETALGLTIHNLNHDYRRCLHGRHACLAFGSRRNRVTFSKRWRQEILNEILIIQHELLDLLPAADAWHQRLAHCRACETVLQKYGLILVEPNRESTPGKAPGFVLNQVLPDSDPRMLP